MVTIELTWFEQKYAEYVGKLRRSESIRRGLSPNAGLQASDENKEQMDIEGAAAEIAVAKATNRYYSGSVNAPKADADVGTNIQVRSTKHENGCLVFRDGDIEEHYYFLAVGTSPEFKVIGFIKGSDAKKEEWRKAPNGRTPAYFVPQSALIKLEEK